MDFDKIKRHIEAIRKEDPDYADWARENFKRILAVFFAKGS